MKFLKRLFRKPAIYFVTLYANYIYKQGVEAADRRHAREGNTIYLIEDPFRPSHLVIYDKLQFKINKSMYSEHDVRFLNMIILKYQCYYYTADRFGRNGISDKEREIRRKAFIKDRLKLAKLI